MSSSTPDVTQSSPPTAQSTSVENGWNMPQLSYENLNRLAKEKFWPAVDVVVAKYQENPSQTLLLATLSLLAFIPLSAFVALLFLVATLATTLLMLALQITLVLSSIFIAACLSVLSLSTLSTPGIARIIAELNHARELAARYFKPSASRAEPAQSGANAGSSADAPQPQGRGFIRRRVVPMLLRPKVILALIAFTIAAPPIIFLLRHVIVSLLIILLNVIVGLIIRASENFFVLASLIGYIGYRLGSPSKSRTTEHTSHNMSTPSDAQNTSTTPAPARTASPPTASSSPASPPPSIDFAQLIQYRIYAINIIKTVWKIFTAGLLGGLVQAHHGLMWLINQMADEGLRAPTDERNQTSRTKDTKKSSGDEHEGYEMLPTGSGSALEPRGSLSERKGKAKASSWVSFEEE